MEVMEAVLNDMGRLKRDIDRFVLMDDAKYYRAMKRCHSRSLLKLRRLKYYRGRIIAHRRAYATLSRCIDDVRYLFAAYRAAEARAQAAAQAAERAERAAAVPDPAAE